MRFLPQQRAPAPSMPDVNDGPCHKFIGEKQLVPL